MPPRLPIEFTRILKGNRQAVGNRIQIEDESGIPVSTANPLHVTSIAEATSVSGDPRLDIPRGLIPGETSVNKFGRALSGVQTTDTDIWDRADAAPTQQIWLPPTQARIHNIVSDDAKDDGDPAGNGARTIQVYGLTDWNTAEVSEVLTMNGAGGVNTGNAYVIIHRMKVLTWGSEGPNVGTLRAVAAVDGTNTAQINSGEGQTQMAIYGVPSVVTAYMTQYYVSAIKAALSVSIGSSILVNTIPDDQLLGYLVKHTQGILTDGASYFTHEFNPYFKITGPAIIKIQAIGSAADIDVSAGFDLILVEN